MFHPKGHSRPYSRQLYKTKSGIFHPTDEQLSVISEIANGNNVIVNAVAGSGKTTTILKAARAQPNKKFLILTYNTRLKDETRAKIKREKLRNVEAHSFHAAGIRYYGHSNAKNDVGLQEIFEKCISPSRPLQFDVIAVDECQDLKPIFYSFVYKLASDNNKTAQLLVLGDHRQCIYGFLDADDRFLTAADRAFKSFNDKLWIRKELKITHRLTGNVAGFMNYNVLGQKVFNITKPPGPKVKLFEGDPYMIVDNIATLIDGMIKGGKYTADDFFILAPSVRAGTAVKQTPLNKLVNTLVEKMGHNVHTPNGDDDTVTDEVIQGKISVTTFHQAKGLERKVVVVFNFNRAYFNFFATELSPDVCPNTLYVACTRCAETLLLIGTNSVNGDLPFLKNEKRDGNLEVHQVSKLEKTFTIDKKLITRNRAVTQLTRFLRDSSMKDAMLYIRMKTLQRPDESVKMPPPVTIKGLNYEVIVISTHNDHK